MKPEPKQPEPKQTASQGQRAVSPYQDHLAQFAGRQPFYLQPNVAPPGLERAARAQPVRPAEPAPFHRRLARWALAATGVLSVIQGGQLPSIPVPPQTVSVGSALPPPPPPVPPALAGIAVTSWAGTDVEVPQEYVTAAVQEAAGCTLPVTTSPVLTFSPPPAHGQLVLHIQQDVNAASDHTIDIIVQTQEQKPSEAEIKDAKNSFRDIGSTLLGLLTLSKLAEKAGSKLLDKGMDRAWAALKRMIDELKKRIARPALGGEDEAPGRPETATGVAQSAPTQATAIDTQSVSKPNPILVRLAEAFVTLAEIFDPSESGPRVHPIGFICEKLQCSEEQAQAILHAGPFIEPSPGIWELDPNFGDPTLVDDPAFVKNLNLNW